MFALYRHFDKDGNLLYIGMSANLFRRTIEHKSSSWLLDIATITVEWFEDGPTASAAEAAAIVAEDPPANRKWEPADAVQERAVAAAWLGGGSELTRLRRASQAAGQTLGKGLLHGRYGSPDNPKVALGGDS